MKLTFFPWPSGLCMTLLLQPHWIPLSSPLAPILILRHPVLSPSQGSALPVPSAYTTLARSSPASSFHPSRLSPMSPPQRLHPLTPSLKLALPTLTCSYSSSYQLFLTYRKDIAYLFVHLLYHISPTFCLVHLSITSL